MARRHLYYDPDEWFGMPWWKTQLLEEGLAWEFTEREKSSGGEGGGEVTLEELGVQWA